MSITRWSMDQCKCQLDTTFEDQDGKLVLAKREFFFQCDLHQTFTADEVAHENIVVKNRSLQIIFDHLSEDYKKQNKLEDYSRLPHSFDENRKITVTIANLSETDKTTLKDSVKDTLPEVKIE